MMIKITRLRVNVCVRMVKLVLTAILRIVNQSQQEQNVNVPWAVEIVRQVRLHHVLVTEMSLMEHVHVKMAVWQVNHVHTEMPHIVRQVKVQPKLQSENVHALTENLVLH